MYLLNKSFLVSYSLLYHIRLGKASLTPVFPKKENACSIAFQEGTRAFQTHLCAYSAKNEITIFKQKTPALCRRFCFLFLKLIPAGHGPEPILII